MTIEKLEKANKLISLIEEQKRELNKFQVVKDRLGLKVDHVEISFQYKPEDTGGIHLQNEYHTLETEYIENLENMYDTCISMIEDYIYSLENEFAKL
jgi:hypothetical protein